MKLLKGGIKQDGHADVFWQRSFVEDDQGNILCKIIVCISYEELPRVLNKKIQDLEIDDDLKKWFEEKTNLEYKRFVSSQSQNDIEVLFCIYPQTEGMFQFAQSVQ
jgi:hypothetical protein